jgi:antitoxin component of RelBE/YafQ-DinJ toxin-antitoxin module
MVSTGLRLDSGLHERATQAAADRGLSLNRLLTLALTEFLDHLIPVEELRYTRPASQDQEEQPDRSQDGEDEDRGDGERG